jgi:hypothetical protein
MSGAAIIIRDTASPLLAAVRTEAQAGGIARVMGADVVELTREHLFALNQSRHRPGGAEYYRKAARGTHAETSPTEIKLSINQIGIRQRRFGGRIRAKEKYLTLADAPEAYGKRAREFNDLDFAIAPDPKHGGALRPALVRRVSQLIRYRRQKRADGSVVMRVSPGELIGGKVMFWLTPEVNQKEDPSVLPSGALLLQTARAAALRRLFRLGRQGSSSTST